MKKLILLSFVFALLGFVNLPKEDPSIKWSTTRLTWDDFKGKMKKSDPYDAVTLSAVSNSFSGDNTSLNFETVALFFPKGSKKKAKKQNHKLLNHEQGHFDITELFARKLRKSLQEKKFKNYKTIGRDVDKIYDKNNLAWRKMQDLYDKETNHSENETAQADWDANINNMLLDYKYYKTTNFTVDISYLNK